MPVSPASRLARTRPTSPGTSPADWGPKRPLAGPKSRTRASASSFLSNIGQLQDDDPDRNLNRVRQLTRRERQQLRRKKRGHPIKRCPSNRASFLSRGASGKGTGQLGEICSVSNVDYDLLGETTRPFCAPLGKRNGDFANKDAFLTRGGCIVQDGFKIRFRWCGSGAKPDIDQIAPQNTVTNKGMEGLSLDAPLGNLRIKPRSGRLALSGKLIYGFFERIFLIR